MTEARALEILDRLIAFPTVSSRSNLDLIEYIRALLAPLGARILLAPNSEGTKANLYAVLGPAVRGGVMLSGHTDVVPVEGQAWSTDPFRVTRRGDAFFGRGACDMKGFLACVLAAAETASARLLSRPLHMAFSYDEEVGCVGVRGLLDQLAKTTHLPSICVIGEPTGMRTAVGHKGKTAARVVCRGKECHSSHAPEGLNAIHLATDIIGLLRKIQDELAAGPRDDDYAVPFTTVHVGTIRGGTALNIVPNECVVDFEIRNLARDNPTKLLDRIFNAATAISQRCETMFPGTGVSVEVVNSYPGLETPLQSKAVDLLARVTDDGPLSKIAFGTEGGLFHERLGVSTVICGPGHIRDAHKADEFVSQDQMTQCTHMLDRLLAELAP
jgi:acetylornithine deacetylase